jgi:hypothetical protein
MGHKNQKGTVSITQYNGRIRLRWRKDCKRYSIGYFAQTAPMHRGGRRFDPDTLHTLKPLTGLFS